MQTTHTLTNSSQLPLALTIGNFDGVHIGHQAILNTLAQTAQQQGYYPAAMTFSPHAKVFFGNATNFLISSDTEKAHYLAEHGINILYQIPFNQSFSEIKPSTFVEQLIHQLHVKYLLVGDDFRFGHQGRGNFQLLSEICNQHQVTVQHTPTIRYGEHRVSSSRIRTAIHDCDFDLAAQLLGRPLQYRGEVISGQQLGRTINFPTANIRLAETRLLPSGAFAVRVSIDKDTTVYNGMCNIGTKPTVDNKHIRQLEVHLFDFSGNLYGKSLTITPVAKLRDEQKFSSVDALTQQLQQDKRTSAKYLSQYTTP